MREIHANQITELIEKLFLQANYEIGADVMQALKNGIKHEASPMGKNILDVDEEVEELFARYSWPGNVRELRNIIEGAFNIVSGRIIRRMDLPEYFIEPLNSFPSDQMMATQDDMLFEEGFSLDEAINSMEKNMIARALRTTRSQAEAARLLGISRQTLSYKILKHRIEK